MAIERDADSWRTAVDRLEAFYAKSPLFNRMEAV